MMMMMLKIRRKKCLVCYCLEKYIIIGFVELVIVMYICIWYYRWWMDGVCYGLKMRGIECGGVGWGGWGCIGV